MCNFSYLVSIIVLFNIVQAGSTEDTKLKIRGVRSPGNCMLFCPTKSKSSKTTKIQNGGQVQTVSILPAQLQPQQVPPSPQYDALPCPAGTLQMPYNGDYISSYPTECHYFYNCRFRAGGFYDRIVFRCPPNYYFAKTSSKCEPAANAEACYGPPQPNLATYLQQSQANYNVPQSTSQGINPAAQALNPLSMMPPIAKPMPPPPPPPEDDTPGETKPGKKLTEIDIAIGTEKLPWNVAKVFCEENDLILMVIENNQDNEFLNAIKRLRLPPFRPAKEGFWSGARFKSAAYNSLFWEPTKQPISMDDKSIVKWSSGEPFDDSQQGNDLCVEIQFPGDKPPQWSASDCATPNYFICVRPSLSRDPKNKQAVIAPMRPGGTIPYDKAGENTPQITELKRHSVAVSKGKLAWVDAIARCEKSGLRLMILDVPQDVTFFNEAKILKEKPYDATTKFWSAGKMVQNDGDSMSLFWEPIHREFANYTDDKANLIEKKWDGVTATSPDEEVPLCIDVQFPQTSPPRWSASDCLEKRHYICTRTPQDRVPEKASVVTAFEQAQIVDDKEDED